MLAPTHLFFAYALAEILRLPRLPAIIGGVIVDMDMVLQYGFPFMHRGIVHTPLIMIVSMMVLYIFTKNQDQAFSFGLGYLSHLFLDTLNPTGIMWLYPYPMYFSLNLAQYNNLIANAGIIFASLLCIVFYRWKNEQRA